MRTTIIYEDNDIIVCIKPAGFPVQSAKMGSSDMESELKNYLKRTTGSAYLGIVHRLDQPVRGVMVFAKNAKAAASLSRQVQAGSDKSMYKYYEALCYGNVPGSGTFEDYLIKDSKTNTSRVCESTDKQAKKAVLDYEVIENSADGYSKLGIHLHTGRHHQIRVQLAYHGYPLLGDQKYGNEASMELSNKLGIKNTQLAAVKLEFIHPTTNKKIIYDINETGTV